MRTPLPAPLVAAFALAAAATAATCAATHDAAPPADVPTAPDAAAVPAAPRRRPTSAAPTVAHAVRAARPLTDAAPPGGDRDTFVVVPANATCPPTLRRLRGRVTDASGAPVAGVRVELLATWLPAEAADAATEFEVGQSFCFWSWTGTQSSVTTDDDGAFSLRYADGGVRALFVRRDAREPGRLRGEPAWIAFDPPADEPAEIVLPAHPCRAEGRVLGPDGAPVPGAEVTLATTACPSPGVREFAGHHCDPPNWSAVVTADAEGAWSCDVVPCGDVVVRASPPAATALAGSASVRVRGTPGAPTVVSLHLRSAAAPGSARTE